MAISGEMIWDVAKFPITTKAKPDTDWDERVADRWYELLGVDRTSLKGIIKASTLSEDDKKKLLLPGYYPKITWSGATATVALMTDGQFPNIINHNGESRSPDGQLGLPEQNEFAGGDADGKVVSITDPAI